MSERQAYVRSDKPFDQAATAEAIRRMSAWLDIADDRTPVTIYPGIKGQSDPDADERAWMWALLVLIDVMDIPTDVLRGIANSISLGVQGELYDSDRG